MRGPSCRTRIFGVAACRQSLNSRSTMLTIIHCRSTRKLAHHALRTRTFSRLRFSTGPNSPSDVSAVRGFRKYASYFKSHPASHLASFAILHELTAIIPLPLVYFFLSTYDIPMPFPENVLAEGNRRMGKMLEYFGLGTLEENSKTMLHMATSYAVVKAAMPLRVGLCFLMTPWFARYERLGECPLCRPTNVTVMPLSIGWQLCLRKMS